ncbi:MAG TPA: subtype I-B CRISPR-associated endonuclease Cas1 [Clostridiales bacterium]|nr:MAG: subtype I-B CRISPR-associated endonuclease Cas1 [Clostridiales bacterium GWD2_32_59]HAN10255.1 subtype I-B CRISPR-associated endonuclease Cas1 [Clostridiales bacterium]
MKRNYYITKCGELKRKDNSLIVILEDNEKHTIPIETVDTLYIIGEVTLNSKLIDFISSKGITMHFFNYYGYYSGSYYPRETLNSGFLLVNQVEHYSNNKKRLFIAKEILKAGTYNIHRNLRYYNTRGKDLQEEIDRIAELREKLDLQGTVEQLMGIEGNIRETYYRAFNKIINQEINFEKRVKRPPDNMINSLISFINSLMYTTITSEIYHTQLVPTISYLHQPGTKRFSLSLDISEIFKPLIVDRLIFSLLNKNQITEDDFESKLNYLYLKDKGKRVVLEEYENKIQTTLMHKKLGRNVSYKHLIRLELYRLVKHLTGEEEYEGFKIWW